MHSWLKFFQHFVLFFHVNLASQKILYLFVLLYAPRQQMKGQTAHSITGSGLVWLVSNACPPPCNQLITRYLQNNTKGFSETYRVSKTKTHRVWKLCKTHLALPTPCRGVGRAAAEATHHMAPRQHLARSGRLRRPHQGQPRAPGRKTNQFSI